MRSMALTAADKVLLRSQGRRIHERTTTGAGLDSHLRDPELLAELASIVARERQQQADAQISQAIADAQDRA